MKRKGKSKFTTSSDVVTKPLTTQRTTYVVKCVYSSTVIVVGPETGKKYRFEPGQQREISDKRDYDHLLSLVRNAGRGCCGDSVENRHYFEAV